MWSGLACIRFALACRLLLPALLTLLPGVVGAQEFAPLFNGKNLDGWRRQKVQASVRDGVLRVGDGRGWLRHDKVFNDFELKFEARLVGQGARGGVTVRAWPVATEAAILRTSYQLTLAATSDAAKPAEGGQAEGERPVPGSTSAVRVATTAAADSWHRVSVTCRGDLVTVTLDEETLIANQPVRSPQGFVGFWVDAGAVELRAIELKELPLPDPVPPPGVYSMRDVTEKPKLRRDVRPAYTSDAMRAQVSGVVLMEAVVQADGSVGDIKIRRSLDPVLGLDVSAMRAAKQWLFQPGTKDGRPVPVLVTIEMSFTLKK